MSRAILCLDFDGVLHSYTSGWQGADVIPDPPVEGAMRFIWEASDVFALHIFSSRSHQKGGKKAMQRWLAEHFLKHWQADLTTAHDKLADIKWPKEKPAAFLTIDDRALTFTGVWPDVQSLTKFRPWNKP